MGVNIFRSFSRVIFVELSSKGDAWTSKPCDEEIFDRVGQFSSDFELIDSSGSESAGKSIDFIYKINLFSILLTD